MSVGHSMPPHRTSSFGACEDTALFRGGSFQPLTMWTALRNDVVALDPLREAASLAPSQPAYSCAFSENFQNRKQKYECDVRDSRFFSHFIIICIYLFLIHSSRNVHSFFLVSHKIHITTQILLASIFVFKKGVFIFFIVRIVSILINIKNINYQECLYILFIKKIRK